MSSSLSMRQDGTTSRTEGQKLQLLITKHRRCDDQLVEGSTRDDDAADIRSDPRTCRLTDRCVVRSHALYSGFPSYTHLVSSCRRVKTFELRAVRLSSSEQLRAPVVPPSVHTHGGEGGGGALIQDATHVAGHVHRALLVHQDEGVFLGTDRELQAEQR